MWVGAHLNTVVTDWAVWAPRRPVEATSWAPFHSDLDPSDLHSFVERSTEVILLVLVLLGYKHTYRGQTHVQKLQLNPEVNFVDLSLDTRTQSSLLEEFTLQATLFNQIFCLSWWFTHIITSDLYVTVMWQHLSSETACIHTLTLFARVICKNR